MRRNVVVLMTGLSLAVAGAGVSSAKADVCVPGGVSLPCNPFAGVGAGITANVANPIYRSGLSFLAGTARALYPVNQAIPGDPCHLQTPGDPCRPFLASFVAYRVLELTNAGVAGSGGYSCSSAGAVEGAIRGLAPLYPSGLFSPQPSPILPGDPCQLLSPSP
jgi:hypothetical protein